jgi:hypothetical protein
VTPTALKSAHLLIAAAIASTVPVACAGPGVVAAEHIAWRIVDSSWSPSWDPMSDSIVVYRVAVQRRGSIDTLRDMIEPWPVAVSDSTIVGVQLVRRDPSRQFLSFTLPSRRTSADPMSPDMEYQFNDVAVSPDGRYVAYVAADSVGLPYGMVRELSSRTEVARGPSAAGCECDVDMNHARWVTPDSFEIAVVNTGSSKGGPRYLLMAGNARLRRLHTTGLPDEPGWHASSRP